jgi:ribonuclease HI
MHLFGRKNGIYPSKSGYNWLLSLPEAENHSSVSWNWIWRLKVPAKIKFLIWLACHDATPTLALLNHKNMVNSAICARCGDQDETFLHCVRDCTFSSIIWQRIGFAYQSFFFSNSITDWLQEGVKCSRTSVFFVALWWLWKHRNLMCLSNETMSVTRLCCNIFSYAESISTSMCNPSSATAPARLFRWNRNNHMCTILNVDGSCNGDPIRTGFGGVIRNSSGNCISGFSSFINNSQDILFAELTTLHQGLILAISLNCGDLACYSDSLLTVNLIKDDLPQYHVYVVLIQNIKDLLNSRNYSLQHLRREGNQCADFMAILGASTDDIFLSIPPLLRVCNRC